MQTPQLPKIGFETIRNNTALKHAMWEQAIAQGFETIRNNTALKRGGGMMNKQEVLKPFETTQL